MNPHKKDDRVESTAPGDTQGRFGTVMDPKGGMPNRIYIRWDGNVLANGYPIDGNVASGLLNHGKGETTTSVAKSVSLAIDEHVKNEPLWDIEGGLAEITEVSLRLKHFTNLARGPVSVFRVTTSDGQTWDVQVSQGRKS